MPRLFKNAPIIIVILAVIALIVLMVYTEAGKEKASMVEDILGQACFHYKRFYSVSQYVYNVFSDIGERRNMIRDYDDLQARLVDLEMELIRLEELEKQNERLKKLALFVDENKEMIVTGATVIAKNPELVQQYNNRQGFKAWRRG